MRTFGIVMAGLLLFAGVVVAGYTIAYYTADIRGRVSANEQIKSGSNRIVQYDHFFNLCASIQGNEAQLDANFDELESASGPNRERVQANITGVRAARLGAIARYNADASKNYTSGQFRDSDLPYQIPAIDFVKGYRTTCASN